MDPSTESPLISSSEPQKVPVPTQDSNTPNALKRQRISASISQEETSILCHLTRVPVEILAEILSYTASPKDVLALARTSKYFCKTLIYHLFIWKHARERTKPKAIPDPPPGVPEPAYAALIFDDGPCENCKKRAKRMFSSFSLRLRLCHKNECGLAWRDKLRLVISINDGESKLLPWIPSLEFVINGGDIASRKYTYRKSDFQQGLDEYNKAASEGREEMFLESKKPIIARLQIHAEHFDKLIQWTRDYDSEAKRIKATNVTMTKIIANQNGWNSWDVSITPIYASLLKVKNSSLEVISPGSDIEFIRPKLESQLLAMISKRQKHEDASAHERRWADIALYHHQLSTSNKDPKLVIPPLYDFRKLPSMQLMQNKISSTKGIIAELKHVTVQALLKDDLARWEEKSKDELAKLLKIPLGLGQEKWKDPSKKKLHPAERLNARFRCKKCDANRKKSYCGLFDGGFGFREACGHDCRHNGKKNIEWNAENFTVDVKVVDVVNQVLSQLKLDPANIDSLASIKTLGNRIECVTCMSGESQSIIMDFNLMLRHCNRHETMTIEVLPALVAEAKLQRRAIPVGMTLKLTKGSKEALKARHNVVYVCKHCSAPQSANERKQEEATDTTSGPEPTTSTIPSSTVEEASTSDQKQGKGNKKKKGSAQPQKKKSVFAFDALRSHAKERHRIAWIGDEDFYLNQQTQLSESS
ncbi:hypothetical protein C8Q75DRAFT_889915 [Abortiporus biennis]|nr:hypothetical protein C8Q75DRAFT_889915 [Abortiporus biennis]